MPSASRSSEKQMELAQKVFDDATHFLLQHAPAVQHVMTTIVETIFVPRVVARQLACLIALETGLVTLHHLSLIISYTLGRLSSRNRLIRQLSLLQLHANTQDEWMDLAERMDQVQQLDVWRSESQCPLYEFDRIKARIDEFVHLLRRGDLFDLMFVLRGGIGRNTFGLLHEGLFSKARAGTKVLVETYHSVVCQALDYVCDASVNTELEEPIPTDARLAFFNETRHSYGRTALLLSGGAALGFYHVGVVKTLMDNGLMPRVLGGSSAGSILCSMIGTRTDHECLRDLFEARGTDAPGHSGELRLNFFRPVKDKVVEDSGSSMPVDDDQSPAGPGGIRRVYRNTAGAFHDAKRTIVGFMPIPVRHLTSFVYDILTGHRRPQDLFKSDTAHFRECVRLSVGNFTFQEAFDRTGRILNIVVTPNNSSDPPRLLNYLTAPHVLVWSAAVASSSLPGVFEANRLVVKEADGWERYESAESQHFSDGSMEQDLPMQQLSEMFNVNHFIISQANPHAVMFASYNQKGGVWTNPVTGFVSSIVTFLRNQLRSWLLHLVQCIGARRIAPVFETQRGIGTQFFTQEYEGRSTDISLVPWLGHRSVMSALLHVIYNPSPAEFREWVQAAERETWKYIPAIKSHIAEEITLDRCVQRLRTRLIQESWDKQRNTDGTEEHLGSRVPSFFNSPSLVNLGGLGVSDQPNIEGLHRRRSTGPSSPSPLKQPQPLVQVQANLADFDINSGWVGLGLRGNRSSGNLQRTTSDASGLFIDEPEDLPPAPLSRQQQQQQQKQQDPGESATPRFSANLRKKSDARKTSDARNTSVGSIKSVEDAKKSGYIKTTSMAHFYYRKVNSQGQDLAAMGRTKSDPIMESAPSSDVESDDSKQDAEARKTQSHGDLQASVSSPGEKWESLKE